eukprot:EG_transcript_7364
MYVASKHPLLGSNVYQDGSTAVFRTANVHLVPATVIVVSEGEAATHEKRGEPWWQQVVDDEMNVPFQLGCPTPLFRLAWVSRDPPRAGPPFEHVLAVQYHHCVGDGTSGNIITHDVLSHLAAAEPPAPVLLPLLLDPEHQQFPELEASLTPTEQATLAGLEAEVKAARSHHTLVVPYDTEFAVQHPHGPWPNAAQYRSASADVLRALHGRCKQRGMTVGAFLLAAVYFATAKVRAAEDAAGSVPFALSFDMDVNLRPRFATPRGPQDVGLMIGITRIEAGDVGPATLFWPLARQLHGAIQTQLDGGHPFLYHCVNRRFDWTDTAFVARLEANHGRPADLNFSNIGRYQFPLTYGDLQLRRQFCVGSSWTPFFGSYTILFNATEQLGVSIVSSPSERDKQIAAAFMDAVMALIADPAVDDDYDLHRFLAA